MVSEMAMEDIESMKEEGLEPSPRDIVRLNALALNVELSQSSSTLYELPRVAFLGSVAFREPTIGHGIWIDSVSRYCDAKDMPTMLAVRAYALAHSADALTDPDDRAVVVREIDAFTKKELAPFTITQINCAITYASHGADATALEYPPLPPDSESWQIDDAASVGAGVLYETLAMGLGVSVRDITRMTVSRAKALQEAGMARHGFDISKNCRGTRVAEYIAAKNEVKNRLLEKKNG